MSSPAPLGQVCDRCRQKKVKCDGKSPACSACIAAGVSCDVSTKLQRKTKIRGYSASDSEFIKKLEIENAELRKSLLAEKQTSHVLREELQRQTQQTDSRPRKVSRINPRQIARSPVVSASGESERSTNDPSAHIIKHMGRLVHDERGVGRFAGSTTGVHFVLSVEEACRRTSHAVERFPETAFSLHLLQHPVPFPAAGLIKDDDLGENIRQCFNLPLSYYKRQIELFKAQWGSFCPIVACKTLVQQLEQAYSALQDPSQRLLGSDYAAVQSIMSIMLINRIGESVEDAEEPSFDGIDAQRAELACRLHVKIASRGDLFALQALILFSFYVQLTGQRLWLVQLNGLMVQLAQSLGLHRHSRRFKFCAGEVELRKRIWWWVYCFDKGTSIVHGLPKLISDADVDNDMPTDCEIDDIASDLLSHPLPGEPSGVSIFVHYAHLGQILSTVLDQLYTTTRRRGGSEKIARIERDLRVWNHAVNSHPHIEAFEIGRAIRNPRGERLESPTHAISSWLQLLSNIAMLLVHRPGLTFDSQTKRFRDSLQTCVSCTTAIVDLLEENPLTRGLHNICPAGPSVAFQCGLMHIFYHVNSPAGLLENAPSRSDSDDVVSRAIRILEDYATQSSSMLSTERATNHEASNDKSISDAAQSLQKLSYTFLRTPEQTSIVIETSPPTELSEDQFWLNTQQPLPASGGSGSLTEETNQLSTLDLGNLSTLENLNHLSDFDWIFDQTGPFVSGPIDFQDYT